MKKLWFWFFLLGSMAVTAILWPRADPFVGRWILLHKNAPSDAESGYEFFKFGRFQTFGQEADLFGTYKRRGDYSVELVLGGFWVAEEGNRVKKHVGNLLPPISTKNVMLTLTHDGQWLETEIDPWVGRTTIYYKVE